MFIWERVNLNENTACNEQFLLFPQCFFFFTRLENFHTFSLNFKLSSADSFNLEEFKICRLGKGQFITKPQSFRLDLEQNGFFMVDDCMIDPKHHFQH